MKTALRIAVIGSHCTGKTTLCHQVRDTLVLRGYDCRLFEGIGRRIAARGFPLDQHCTMDTYFAFITAHMTNLAAAPSGISLYDRSILDFAAYVRANANASPGFDEMLVALCRLSLISFDLVYYLPPEIILVADGQRNTDIQYRSEVDRCLVDLLEQLGAEYVSVVGDTPIRLQRILQDLEPLLASSWSG